MIHLYGNDAAVSVPEIVHVHGRLPSIEAPLTRSWIAEAAPAIRVVLDDLDPETIERAREAIGWADVVCFVGFGFQHENLVSLDFSRSIKPGAAVFGSALGLMEGERSRIVDECGDIMANGRIVLGSPDHGAYEFLRRHYVLRSPNP
jgi:hypothetical protein